MSEMIKRGILLVVLLVTACTMPETKIYSLYLPLENKTPESGAVVSITVGVSSPRYLAQPYIAHRTSPYQINVSGYSKWESAPAEMVRDAFRDSLAASGMFREVKASNLFAEGFYSLKIYLKRFERLDTGEGSFGDLAFEVSLLSPAGNEVYRGEISRKFRMEERNFPGLAKTLSNGLGEAIEEVKGHVIKILPGARDARELP